MVYDSNEHLSDVDTVKFRGFYPYLKHFVFLSENEGYYSNGRLFTSEDGGKSWQVVALHPPKDLSDLECTAGNCPYLDTVSVPQFTSPHDGWLIRRVFVNSDKSLDVFVYYPNTLSRMPLPFKQYLYTTLDGGQTWIPKTLPVVIGTSYFVNERLGWILGKNESDPESNVILYQSSDGGDSWTQISADCPLPLGSEIQFVDDLTGFAFTPLSTSDFYIDFDNRLTERGEESFLFVTTDGGYSWMKIEPQIAP